MNFLIDQPITIYYDVTLGLLNGFDNQNIFNPNLTKMQNFGHIP
jgi:hypothetical protein